MTKYTELWDGIKNLIERNSYDEKIDDKPGEYGKDFMKIKFNSDDSFLLNKILKLHFNNSCQICFSRRQQVLFTNFFR